MQDGYRRNANQYIRGLIDLINRYHLTLQIVHNGNERNLTNTLTDKSSISMEKISLTTILNRTILKILNQLL